MCREVEQFVQGKDAPNLYGALDDLPAPLVDVEQAIENEKKVSAGEITNEALRQQLEGQMRAAHDRVRAISSRFQGSLGALQCVEAIRSYAAGHGGQLPGNLSEIKDV